MKGRLMNNEERHEAKCSTSKSETCCGPEMEQRMQAFFASLCSEDAPKSGSCADWMKDMMKSCFRPSADREPTER
jgi:hypothetical protein